MLMGRCLRRRSIWSITAIGSTPEPLEKAHMEQIWISVNLTCISNLACTPGAVPTQSVHASLHNFDWKWEKDCECHLSSYWMHVMIKAMKPRQRPAPNLLWKRAPRREKSWRPALYCECAPGVEMHRSKDQLRRRETKWGKQMSHLGYQGAVAHSVHMQLINLQVDSNRVCIKL